MPRLRCGDARPLRQVRVAAAVSQGLDHRRVVMLVGRHAARVRLPLVFVAVGVFGRGERG